MHFPYRIYISRLHKNTKIGLGDLIKLLTTWLGIKPCARCNKRANFLNQWVEFSGKRYGDTVKSSVSPQAFLLNFSLTPRKTSRFAFWGANPCLRFYGPCTGFGRRQCVSAPTSQTPDANIVQQCCNGWFQYPWIEVCPGQPVRKGCGFCFW